MKPHVRARVESWLSSYAVGLSSTTKGWRICCPFHDDSTPSCTVFYDTGIFSCLGCGRRRPPQVGFVALGAPQSEVDKVFSADSVEFEPLKPLEQLEVGKPKDEHEAVGVLTETAWNPKWNYRAIRGSFLVGESPVGRLFRPSLVRLILKDKRGIEHQERFSRLSLHYGEHRIFLRLSSEQEVRIYNSPGLRLSDPKLPPFGLSNFKLRKELAGLILVEGPYDLMRTVQNLYDLGIGENFEVIALLGVGQWEAFLKKFELRLLPWLGRVPVITAFDNDKAGDELTKVALPALREMGVASMALRYEASDPGDETPAGLSAGLIKLGF